MFSHRTKPSDRDERSYYLSPRKQSRSNLLIHLILFSSVVNAFQALLIGLNTAWFNKVAGSGHGNGHGSIYRESVKTIDKPLYPERLYDQSLVARTVEEVIGRYNPDEGIVALPREGLLPSEPFPWDSTKDVYAYHGYHSLHSVQVIYQTLSKLAGNRTISGHALHSLVVLWEDSLCTADMTPRSVAKNILVNDTSVAEAGQIRFLTFCLRVCRDWGLVEAIIRENTACFEDLGAAKAKTSIIEEWMHCPQDSPYQEKVNDYIAYAKGGK